MARITIAISFHQASRQSSGMIEFNNLYNIIQDSVPDAKRRNDKHPKLICLKPDTTTNLWKGINLVETGLQAISNYA
ncbi:MAG TPA: hypothetical protein PK819_10875 [Thermomicrobiales bacterium]|nr:hypothetical protein [Thermomicrobiales bacterium]